MSQRERASAVSVWTLVQVVGILVWIAGFVIAFYFVTYSKQPTDVKQNGQIAGMILTGFAYLLIVFSMIKHSPDGRK